MHVIQTRLRVAYLRVFTCLRFLKHQPEQSWSIKRKDDVRAAIENL